MEELSVFEKQKITSLLITCTEMLNGKFILADHKITAIIRKITESSELYGLFTQLMQTYNFDKELSRALVKLPTKLGFFDMPKEVNKMLPLVFCLLLNIQNHRINFPDLLHSYFARGENEYRLFNEEVILPFRNAIAEMYGISEEEIKTTPIAVTAEQHEEQPEEENTDNEEEIEDYSEQFNKIIALAKDMIVEIECSPKLLPNLKDDAILILEGLIEAAKLQNLKILNGLIIGFDIISPKIKNIRFLYKELKEVLVSFYSEIKVN